jgi:hypothetical protein
MLNYDEWVMNSDRTTKFLTTMSDLPKDKKDFITPIALSSNQFAALQATYQRATRKVGFVFNAPLFSLGTIVHHKHNIWFITSAYLLNDFDKFLKINLGMGLDFDEYYILPSSKEILDKFVRFSKDSYEKLLFTPVKTKYNGYAYGFKVIDEYYSFRPI